MNGFSVVAVTIPFANTLVARAALPVLLELAP